MTADVGRPDHDSVCPRPTGDDPPFQNRLAERRPRVTPQAAAEPCSRSARPGTARFRAMSANEILASSRALLRGARHSAVSPLPAEGTIAAAHGVLRGVNALHLGYTLAA